MSRKSFKLSKVHKAMLFGCVATVGLISLGVVASQRQPEEVEASSNNNLPSIMPSQMTRLNLTKIYTGAEVDSSINSTQSFTITDNYFVAVQAHSVNENAGWLVATSFTNPSSTPAWEKSYNVRHGNGATWNSSTDQIVITDDATRFFFDADNGNFVKSINIDTYASGIAYDKAGNKYIQASGGTGRILDSNFNSLLTFDASHRLVNQDMAYHAGRIYRVAWGGCSYLMEDGETADANYCYNYFGEDSDVIYEFDMNGDFTRAFYMGPGTGELESIDFGPDGAMYLLFNGDPDYLHYSVYKADLTFREDQTVTFANSSVTKTFNYNETFTNRATTTGDGAITYRSSDANVATVNSSTGEVTIKGAGTATITATAAETANYNVGSTTYTLTVNKKKSAEPAEIRETKSGYYTDTLATIELSTEGLSWADDTLEIGLGQNKYKVYYIENNDERNYTKETFEITVNGVRRSYKVIDGDGQTHTIGEDGGEYTSFRIDAAYDLFESGGEVYIDDEILAEEYYQAEAGSTVINIRNDYLESLALGEHTITVYFGDGGEATARFELVKEDTPVDPEPDSDTDSDTGGDKKGRKSSNTKNEDTAEQTAVPNTSAPDTGDNTKDENSDKPDILCMLPVGLAIVGALAYTKRGVRRHRKFD